MPKIVENRHWEQVFTDIISPTEEEPWGFLITHYDILMTIYDTINPTTGKREARVHEVVKRQIKFFIDESKNDSKKIKTRRVSQYHNPYIINMIKGI